MPPPTRDLGSGAPLATKLGIRADSRVLLDGPPGGFDLGAEAAAVHLRPGKGPYDVGVLFCAHRTRLVHRWAVLHERVTPAGRLWVAWPKRAGGLQTDLDENAVRTFGLEHGRVDVKVCAIDGTWSGLAFVVRLVDRGDADRGEADRTGHDRQQVAAAGTVREVR